MTNTEKLSQLLELIRKLSYQKREVTLASGKKSDFYIDMKNTLLHPVGIKIISELIAEKIQQLRRSGLKIKGVGGLTMGADPLSTGVSLVTADWEEPLFAVYIRKEPKEHGTQAWLEGMKNFTQGDNIIILEDVVTTGGSTLKSIERAKLGGLNVVGVITAVDRQEGGAENIKASGQRFDAVVTKQMILG
ncbi:MAG: orotate phosphoribosyltransferase [Oligoflexia bacterium]|nr:orotate phosphoribosyltransferase [Oligoflexia bacterium]